MRARAVLGACLLTAALGSPASAAAPAGALLTRTTVLEGDRSARFVVEVPEDATIDISPSPDEGGTLMPASLSVAGGSGYVGFLITEPGAPAGFSVLALQLPEPEGDSGGAPVGGIGWGQTEGGENCTSCLVPAGTYDLLLINGDPFDEPNAATVTIEVESARAGTTVLTSSEGDHTRIRQSTSPPAFDGPSNPLAPYSGGFWERFGPEGMEAGFVVDQMVLSVVSRATAPLLTVVEHCRTGWAGESCATEHILGEGSVGRSRISVVGARNGEPLTTRLSWDVLGDARWRATNNVLWLDLTT